MKRLSQPGSSNFFPESRKNALLISQSYFSNFALHMIMTAIENIDMKNFKAFQFYNSSSGYSLFKISQNAAW